MAVTVARFARFHSLARLLRVQAFAGLSQATGALQLGALLLAVGPGRPTDAYVVLFSASQLPIGALILATLQPTILSRRGYGGWHRWTVAGVAITLAVVWLAAGFLLARGYSLHDVIL